ncbi:winged helix-turn-helix transcriptional regulator [Parasedimentitalea psychrophila]|uniref:Helix-turn-helix domain-containing protein n=1 Tax=Parasedimentitalea psychrophila TaxID=2997337 RepID=A0A9Y2P401_9RHOB|nr:helix-turn-helix domain-containing protein [Parasedimentitalea psychrophila]WIY24794.1 helix-turn-helix domain-containing protein [Parasedimentitalea psychrophila]
MTHGERRNCPIQRASNVIGDQWSLLILREFFLEGARRFQDLQDVLKVSPNTLSGRLRKLEEGGVLERRKYSQNPPRWEYYLTNRGQALGPMMEALRSWGGAHAPDLPGEGK